MSVDSSIMVPTQHGMILSFVHQFFLWIPTQRFALLLLLSMKINTYLLELQILNKYTAQLHMGGNKWHNTFISIHRNSLLVGKWKFMQINPIHHPTHVGTTHHISNTTTNTIYRCLTRTSNRTPMASNRTACMGTTSTRPTNLRPIYTLRGMVCPWQYRV